MARRGYAPAINPGEGAQAVLLAVAVVAFIYSIRTLVSPRPVLHVVCTEATEHQIAASLPAGYLMHTAACNGG